MKLSLPPSRHSAHRILDDIIPGNGTAVFGNRSAVTRVNGMDVETYLNSLPDFRDHGQRHDPDARYNTLFLNQFDQLYNGAKPSFSISNHYVGARTTLEFANGTTKPYANRATITKDFSGIENGTAFFHKFCTGSTPSPLPLPQSTVVHGSPSKFGFPQSLITNASFYVFPLEGANDTVILSAPTFEVVPLPKFQQDVSMTSERACSTLTERMLTYINSSEKHSNGRRATTSQTSSLIYVVIPAGGWPRRMFYSTNSSPA